MICTQPKGNKYEIIFDHSTDDDFYICFELLLFNDLWTSYRFPNVSLISFYVDQRIF